MKFSKSLKLEDCDHFCDFERIFTDLFPKNSIVETVYFQKCPFLVTFPAKIFNDVLLQLAASLSAASAQPEQHVSIKLRLFAMFVLCMLYL